LREVVSNQFFADCVPAWHFRIAGRFSEQLLARRLSVIGDLIYDSA
jgi:hypothetical protein